MRVLGGKTANPVGRIGNAGQTSSSSATFSVPQDNASKSSAQALQQSGGVQDVSALLALQGVEDSLQGKRRKALRRGNRMLDLLEQVRMGLLSGSLPLTVLQQLERLASGHGESGDDRIDALLEEIGLRAQVEVAKLQAEQAR